MENRTVGFTNEVIAKCISYIGYAMVVLGILVAILSLTVEDTVLYLISGISTSVFGLTVIGFSILVNAAALYISNNEGVQDEKA